MSTPDDDRPTYGSYSPPPGPGPYGRPSGSSPYDPPASASPYGPPPGEPQTYGRQDEAPLDVVSIVGLVLGITFLLAPLGLLLGVVGLFRTAGGRRRGRGLAIAAVVVSAVMSVLLGLLVAAVVAFGSFVSTTVGELDGTQLEQFQEELDDLEDFEDPDGDLEGLEGRGTEHVAPRPGAAA